MKDSILTPELRKEMEESTIVILLKGIIHCIESPDWKTIDYSVGVENDINELAKTINGRNYKINISFENLKR